MGETDEKQNDLITQNQKLKTELNNSLEGSKISEEYHEWSCHYDIRSTFATNMHVTHEREMGNEGLSSFDKNSLHELNLTLFVLPNIM